ncbi:hypothetical protein D8I24_3258 (plasmid) [Cupriavidus necator H850]|uniref:MaoC/PaaZ C-terminal domain-containing protein n=1 Tax=Cupriavidus necator TaxID=106590 RepID=UPI00129E5FFC|nr:MaoC/PaaZ C-terminal domain-containing protein [Cupriavidus necator]KAI3602707.1 hypothetical protein D8I24_3258 [Cupriavidus necator H850]
MELHELAGMDLGARTLRYESRDAILYALAVGASAEELDLVYERDLRVLPTMACGLGLWAVEKAGDFGAYDRKKSLHAAQRLQVHRPLPRQASFESHARVAAVWDKGRATVVEIEVASEFFTASYTIYLPGIGNWGGRSGPESAKTPTQNLSTASSFATSRDLAALYRLTGDLHPIHIDPTVAQANGFERPILHGLCTLGIAARLTAQTAGVHPAELRSLSARLSAPVFPGDEVTLRVACPSPQHVTFDAIADGKVVLKDGAASFAASIEESDRPAMVVTHT